jgi:hypothetical protein
MRKAHFPSWVEVVPLTNFGSSPEGSSHQCARAYAPTRANERALGRSHLARSLLGQRTRQMPMAFGVAPVGGG